MFSSGSCLQQSLWCFHGDFLFLSLCLSLIFLILLQGKFVPSSPFIYSITYLPQYGLTHILLLGVEATPIVPLLLRLFQLWPVGSLPGHFCVLVTWPILFSMSLIPSTCSKFIYFSWNQPFLRGTLVPFIENDKIWVCSDKKLGVLLVTASRSFHQTGLVTHICILTYVDTKAYISFLWNKFILRSPTLSHSSLPLLLYL